MRRQHYIWSFRNWITYLWAALSCAFSNFVPDWLIEWNISVNSWSVPTRHVWGNMSLFFHRKQLRLWWLVSSHKLLASGRPTPSVLISGQTLTRLFLRHDVFLSSILYLRRIRVLWVAIQLYHTPCLQIQLTDRCPDIILIYAFIIKNSLTNQWLQAFRPICSKTNKKKQTQKTANRDSITTMCHI